MTMKAGIRHISVALCILCATLLLLGCERSPQEVLLRMQFSDGRELVYELASEQIISIDSPDFSADTSRTKGEMIQTVTEVLPEGSARVKEASYWSWSEPDEDGSVRVVSRDETLSYRMEASGKVSDLEILSDDDAAKWKEYAQSKLEQSQPTFPEEPVGLGYTWMQSVKIFMPDGEMLDAATTYEVTEFVEIDERRCAVIDYTGNLVLPFNVVETDSTIRKGVDKVDVTGTIWFDYLNGYVFSQHEKTMITAERARIFPTEATSYTA
ncbi:MAG: hypothetical protein ABIJ61_04000, partial [bacterium]